MTIEEVYQRTVERADFIRNQGINLIEKWECDFYKEFRENGEMKSFIEQLEILPPLDPRKAFAGGKLKNFCLFYCFFMITYNILLARTNAVKLYHKCKNGEKMYYVDVCRYE